VTKLLKSVFEVFKNSETFDFERFRNYGQYLILKFLIFQKLPVQKISVFEQKSK